MFIQHILLLLLLCRKERLAYPIKIVFLTEVLIGTGHQLQPTNVNINVNVNAKTAIPKRLAVQIMNPDKIQETKTFSADDENQYKQKR